ncbi:MAG TPA: 3-deoxy-manno-octulosonate cytidylyltransferase, partial [Candidatus Angelobacter sp.]
MGFSAIAIIPARLASTRLPRKVLREIAGQPMIARVYEAAKQSPLLQDVIIATDSEEVMQFAQARGWKAQMTSAEHRSGTDRVYEVAQSVAADVYVNIQGDEPLARPEHLDALLQPMKDAKVMVSTIKTPCPPQDVANPNAVKVVTDLKGRALYFSRSTIPFDRDKT